MDSYRELAHTRGLGPGGADVLLYHDDFLDLWSQVRHIGDLADFCDLVLDIKQPPVGNLACGAPVSPAHSC